MVCLLYTSSTVLVNAVEINIDHFSLVAFRQFEVFPVPPLSLIHILHLSTSGCMGRLHPDVSAPDTRMYGNKTYQLID